MQATSDIFLGWLHVDAGLDGQARDFYGRQLKDWKGSAEIEQMVPKGMATYGKLCGWTLARAHARSGDRIAIAAYLGNGDSFDRAILEFSKAYAEQNDARLPGARPPRSNPAGSPPKQASDITLPATTVPSDRPAVGRARLVSRVPSRSSFTHISGS